MGSVLLGMKSHRLIFAIPVLLFGLASPVSAWAWTATEQAASYQRAMAHLQAARQAMAAAQREVLEAQRSASLPGFDYDRLTGDLNNIQRRLELYTQPSSRQHRYPTFRPDGIYFNPAYTGEHP